MNLLHIDKPKNDLSVLVKICGDVLVSNLSEMSNSDDFAFVFVDGRDRNINSLEDYACFKSCKLYSKYNYPIFAFVHNTDLFLDNDIKLIHDWRINIVRIENLKTLEEYSNFCIKKLYFLIPPEYNHIITVAPDAFLVKNGWEDFIIDNGFSYISSHWRHFASVGFQENNQWYLFNANPVQIGNGAFSYRQPPMMRSISNLYSHLKLAEVGRLDYRMPMEDLFFNFFGQNFGFYKKIPTLSECDLFCQDPYTLNMFENKVSYGFHYPKMISEWPKCQHN